MADTRPSVVLDGGRRLHFSSIDWDSVLATKLAGGKWPVGNLMKPAQTMQIAAIAGFETSGKQIEEISRNRDLTAEAKRRRMTEALDSFAAKVQGPMDTLAENMQSMHEAAQRMFSPVTPLSPDNAVGVAMDVELRSILRNMNAVERNRLLADARNGSHPELVAAILRAPSLASGVTADAMKKLTNAGIVSGYGDDVLKLRELLVNVNDDVLRTTHQAATSLLALADLNGHPQISRWKRDNASQLREWINDLPIRAGQVPRDIEPKAYTESVKHAGTAA